MRTLKWYFFVVLLFGCTCASAQTKYEHEVRVKPEAVPLPAQKYMEGVPVQARVRWYKEYSLTGHSYEAKWKHNSRRYSFEFGEAGDFQDLEIAIASHEVPAEAMQAICGYFQASYRHHRISKIQVQYTDGFPDLPLPGNVYTLLAGSDKIHYEIVIEGHTDEGYPVVEYLFDAQGKLVRRAVVVPKPTENLEY